MIAILLLLSLPGIGTAQTNAPNNEQSQVSTWDLAFTLTKGNLTDRKRLAFLQGEYRCVAAGTNLICRKTDGEVILSGSLTGNNLDVTLEKHAKPTTGNLVDCYLLGWCPEVGGYTATVRLEGQITGQAASGNMKAVLRVGSTDYPVEGTWQAIKVP
jgi:hypothetical protein